MAKRRQKLAGPEAVVTARRATETASRGGDMLPALWEWPLLAALVLSPILAGVLEQLPALSLDLLLFVALFLRLARPPALRAVLPPAVAVPAGALLLLSLLSLA